MGRLILGLIRHDSIGRGEHQDLLKRTVVPEQEGALMNRIESLVVLSASAVRFHDFTVSPNKRILFWTD